MPSGFSDPPRCDLDWRHQYRVIPSTFGVIDFFENLVDPSLMDALLYVEALTNDRLRDEAGSIALVDAEDRISGPGSSPVMAAFTHVGLPSRFSDGRFGLYYAAKTLKTAVEESKYHRARFLAYTQEAPGEIGMRVYVGEVVKPLQDIRGADYAYLHHPDDWRPSQAFGKLMKAAASWGLVYRSVRDPGGACVAALRPPAVSNPRQGRHLSCVWDGTRIATVYEKRLFRA